MQNISTIISNSPFVQWLNNPLVIKIMQGVCALEVAIGIYFLVLIVGEVKRYGLKDFFAIHRFATVVVSAYFAVVSVAAYLLVS